MENTEHEKDSDTEVLERYCLGEEKNGRDMDEIYASNEKNHLIDLTKWNLG